MKTNTTRMIAGWAKKVAVAFVATALALPLTVSAEDVAYDQRVLFYDYASYTLLPELGFASTQNSSMSLSYDQAWENPGWDNRQGLVSARCLDMNKDGIPEMLVTYMVREGDDSNGSNAMYATLYTVNDNWDGVVEVNTTPLFYDNNIEFMHSTGVIMTFGGREYLVVEELSNAYFADGASADYSFYSYDGKSLREYFSVGKTDGGSSEIAYKLVKYNSSGVDSSTLLWADDEYLANYGGNPINPRSPGSAIESGFAMLGLSPAQRVEYTNAEWSLFDDEDNAFLTYYLSDNVLPMYLYDANGSANASNVRNIVIHLADKSKLQSHFKTRGIDVSAYINNPQASKNVDSTEGMMFPESSDRLLTKDDIAGKSWDDLRLGLNEIYAKNGYIFQTDWIREHFEQFGWYNKLYSDQNVVYDNMSQTEQKNVDFLNQYVAARRSENSNDMPEDYNSEIVDDPVG